MDLKISGLNEFRERLERLRADEVMARTLAEQADRMAARVREGLSEPPGGGGHDEPWLQSGALRDSVGAQADGLQAAVGSSDPAAVPQELGTARMPARPFLAPVAAGMGEEVARAVGAVAAAAIRGDNPDANGMDADLSEGGLDGNDPPNRSGAGAGAPTFTSNANATGVGGLARPAMDRSNTDGFDSSGVRLVSEPGAPRGPGGTPIPLPAHDVTNVQFNPAPGALFATPQEAANHAIESINPTSIAENREYNGKIRIDPITGMYYATPPVPGSETKAGLSFNQREDQLTVGDYHTHGNYFGYDAQGNEVIGNQYYDTTSGTDSENFSRPDRDGASELAAYLGKPNYFLWLGTPSGAIKQYSIATGETATLKPGN